MNAVQFLFTKMHGLGNDFIMLDLISQNAKLLAKHVRKLADRRRGIGCDQVLTAEPPESPDADFRCRIYNANGSEAEQCGNGVRCLAVFVRDRHLTTRQRLRVETPGGIVELEVLKDRQVRVNMGAPRLAPADIPFLRDQRADEYTLALPDRSLQIGALSMGNPHAVSLVDDIDTAPVAELGPQIERHGDFPKQVNAGFMQVLSREEIRLRVHERGVGETPACGSGACAAVVVGRLRGLLDETVTARLPGGALEISWAGEGQAVMMTGPATKVFDGRILA